MSAISADEQIKLYRNLNGRPLSACRDISLGGFRVSLKPSYLGIEVCSGQFMPEI
jgi:hypothetical protein